MEEEREEEEEEQEKEEQETEEEEKEEEEEEEKTVCYHIPRAYSYPTSLLVCWTPPAVAAGPPAQPACLPPGLWLTATSPDQSHTDASASEPHCRERQTMEAVLFMDSFVPKLATHSLS